MRLTTKQRKLQEQMEKDIQILNHLNQEEAAQKDLLRKCIEFSAQNLEGTRDVNDKPAILHYLEIMDRVSGYSDPELFFIAILYGVIEHTSILSSEMAFLGLSSRVVNALTCLRMSGVSFSAYIEMLSQNKDTSIIKYVDLSLQLDHARMVHDHEDILKIEAAMAILNRTIIGI